MRSKFKWIFTLLVAFTMQFSFAQQKTVTGTVKSEGASLPGATVRIVGTYLGTQTDENGKFSIKASPGDALEVSFLGKETQTIKIGEENVVNVTLSTRTDVIEVVAVTGALGIKRKKAAVTSSYSTVSNEELKAASNPDPVRALVGKVSGITINATNNNINGSNSIRVRSMLSISGNTEALVVIDDVISTADVFASLPSDVIANVTVLKGAQGAALYGSQGKSGVVIVTTKKSSKDGKLTVSLNSSVDIENINFLPQRQQKYGQGWYGAYDNYENGGWGELFDGSIRRIGLEDADGNIIEAPYSSLGDDSIKDFYKTGYIYQNNLNLNMGGNDGYLNLNLGNLKRDFILDGDNLNRNTVVLNAGKKINRFSLGGTVTFTNQRTKQANVNAATSRGDYSLLTNLLQTASNIPTKLFKDRGIYGWNAYYQNPYWAKDNNRLQEVSNFMNFGLNTSYEINKNISLSHNGSVQLRNTDQTSYSNELIAPAEAQAFGGFSSASQYFQSVFSSTFYYGDFLANFNYDLTSKIGLKLNVGQNIQYSESSRVSQGGTNLEIPGFYNITNVLNPANPSALRNSKAISTLTATFLNADVNYDDYLFLTATFRREGNSVAKKGNQFYNYPSVGLSFIPTKAFESLDNKKTLSNLKLYGNYTKVGSLDPIAAYQILNTGILAGNFPFPTTGNSYQDLTNITNSDIRPEIYTTIEAGVNFGFFNDRLTLDVAGFKTTTDDLITSTSASSFSGVGSSVDNNGTLEAKGFEIDLGFMPINTENFKWSGRASISSYDTRVTDAGESSQIALTGAGTTVNAQIVAAEGETFPTISGTDWIRDNNGNVIVNNEGRPNVDARFKNLGQALPKYILGFTNNFNYKGFGLSFTADFRTGHSFISQTKYNLTWNGHLVDSADFDRNVGFIYPGSVIDNPATATVGDYIPNTSVLTGGFYTLTGNANRTQAYYGQASTLGSFNLIDATALRIREIAFSYSLPAKMIGKTGLSTLKFSVNARNPFVFLADGKFIKAKNGLENRGYADPEASSQFNSSTTTAAQNPGGTTANTSRNGIGIIGDGQYPSTRTIGFSINATF